MTQTFESGYKSTLALRLDPSDTTATLASVPTVTKGRMYLDNGEQKEWIKFTGVSGSTITGLVRGLSQTADPSTAGTGLTWIAGTKIKLVAMHDQMLDKQEGDDPLISAVVYADTAARDSALGADGAVTIPYTNIYVTATGLFYNYNLSSNVWEAVDTGTVTANASTTVAGKVEQSTAAQNTAGTATGETGAPLFSTPADLATTIQSGSWVYCASSTGSDTYTANLTPSLTAYTTGMLLPCKFTTTNTGACSININSLGAKNIKTLDGNDPQTGVIRANGTALLMYDGTNFVIQSEDFATATVNGIMKSDFQKYNFFGDGSDGDVTISSNTTLASDKFYNNLTINNGFTLNPGGYRIFVKGTLTNNGTIARNGNNGGNGGTGTSGTAGAALSTGTVYGSAAGGIGAGRGVASTGPTALGNGQGVSGGNGGTGDAGDAGSLGATVTQERIVMGLEDSTLNTFLFDNTTNTIKNTIVFKGLTSGYTMIGSGSGGGGGAPGTSNDGGGGGGGSAGGVVYISALTIINAGTISSNGGNGGNGGSVGGGADGGGGGGGGGGGPVLLIYGTFTNSGTITSTGGSGGTFGTGGATNGTAGTAGASNAICKIVII